MIERSYFFQTFFKVPSGKQTEQWTSTFSNRKYIYKLVDFPASYVRLPECILNSIGDFLLAATFIWKKIFQLRIATKPIACHELLAGSDLDSHQWAIS